MLADAAAESLQTGRAARVDIPRDWNVRQPGAGHVTRFQPRLPVSGDAALPAQ